MGSIFAVETLSIMKIAILASVLVSIASCLPISKKDAASFIPLSGYSVDRTNITAWYGAQPDASWYYLLQNIDYPTGQFTSAVPGVVVASPSTSNPDYYYQWVRDSALTFLTLVNKIEDHGFGDVDLAQRVEYYINNTYTVQRVSNPTGSFDDPGHKGLGEPKMNLDDTAYTAGWGRPQNDGPALRSFAIMRYLDAVTASNNGNLHLAGTPNIVFQNASDIYNNIIVPDLQYVVSYWNTQGFDLWEENDGMHFFTALVQLKSLDYGIGFANKQGDSTFAATLTAQRDLLKTYINNPSSGFVGASQKHIIESPQLTSRGGLDCATFIAALVSHDQNDGSDIPFNVDNPYVLNSFYYLLNDNKQRYGMNAPYKLGAAMGRYPEDVFNGVETAEGNPWVLSTAYGAQTLYQLASNLYENKKDLIIDSLNYDLYNSYIADLSAVDSGYSSKASVTVPFGSDNFKNITNSISQFADSFLAVILDHIDDNGQTSEEYDRTSGYQTGAVSLTWSSASLIGAFRLREKLAALKN